ncbi:MAG: hypothetical protein MZV64_31445 [Ignavibacteriales bacterium]|nr:hypothetical protein [Ignavibacteriales bacterium]
MRHRRSGLKYRRFRQCGALGQYRCRADGTFTNSVPLPVVVETRSLEPGADVDLPRSSGRAHPPTGHPADTLCSTREPRGYSHEGWLGQ